MNLYFFYILLRITINMKQLIKRFELFPKEIKDSDLEKIEAYIDRIKKHTEYLNFYDPDSQDVETEILKISLKCNSNRNIYI